MYEAFCIFGLICSTVLWFGIMADVVCTCAQDGDK